MEHTLNSAAVAEDHGVSAVEEMMQLVTFKLGSEEFALDILLVQEINRRVEITKVPKTPEFVEGVINLRGKIVPVLDLRKRFGLVGHEFTAQSSKTHHPPTLFRAFGRRARQDQAASRISQPR